MSLIKSFKRYETKYLLTKDQTESFLKAADGLIEKDRYGRYTIRNIYLDTDDFYFVEHSIDKPDYKQKLRVRSYGAAENDADVFFEIKKKYGGVVYKRRIVLPYREAVGYIQTLDMPVSVKTPTDRQIFGEIDYLMRVYRPEPKLYLAYDREAYYLKDDPDLRITLDRNIRSRWEDVMLEYGDCGKLLDAGIKDYRLLELKTRGAVPIELTKILFENRIYPVSFSKYGRIYLEHINRNINITHRNGAAV